jgi:ABC-2 type transport system permease protein
MINVGAFWLTDLRGIYAFAIVLVNLFSGFLVPLAFFPTSLRALLGYLPFAGMVSIPLNIFLERLTPSQLLGGVALQIAWATTFVGAAQLLLRRATHKLVVQGG